VDGDFDVDEVDLATLVSHFNTSNATHAQGDLNYDGQINIADLDLMFAQYCLTLAVAS
jgi:hypothetical protein